MKNNWARWAFMFVGGIGFVLALDGCRGKDSTDPPDGRSGMGLRTDHMTGCQYLTTWTLFGEAAITPRLDGTGRQVCDHQESKP